mmetsp:Transcript_45167/g.109978  ORF Transcript_45167/g.109978 Transcript_45167/m.109978 type:complete len:238 (+) Transcript_45167:3559-4272(+)
MVAGVEISPTNNKASSCCCSVLVSLIGSSSAFSVFIVSPLAKFGGSSATLATKPSTFSIECEELPSFWKFASSNGTIVFRSTSFLDFSARGLFEVSDIGFWALVSSVVLVTVSIVAACWPSSCCSGSVHLSLSVPVCICWVSVGDVSVSFSFLLKSSPDDFSISSNESTALVVSSIFSVEPSTVVSCFTMGGTSSVDFCWRCSCSGSCFCCACSCSCCFCHSSCTSCAKPVADDTTV